MTSRISTLCSGRYIQVTKSLGHHLSGRWSRCTGGRFKKVVVKKGLTVIKHFVFMIWFKSYSCYDVVTFIKVCMDKKMLIKR